MYKQSTNSNCLSYLELNNLILNNIKNENHLLHVASCTKCFSIIKENKESKFINSANWKPIIQTMITFAVSVLIIILISPNKNIKNSDELFIKNYNNALSCNIYKDINLDNFEDKIDIEDLNYIDNYVI